MSARNRNRRGGRVWITVLVAVAVLGVAAYGVMAALKSSPKIDSSSLGEVERGDIARSVVATGKIEPRAKVEVKSKASGIVKKIYVDYGDWVKHGQLLVELDKEELKRACARRRPTCWPRRRRSNRPRQPTNATKWRPKRRICPF